MPIVLRPPGVEIVPLQDRLGRLGRARRRTGVAAGVLRLIALALVLIAAACSLDAALHLPGVVRAILLVGILAVVGVAILRWVRTPLRQSTHPLAVALLLEDQFPRLNDSLASAVDFLESEQTSGMNRFRRVAVKRAENLADRHDVHSVVPTGRMWKSFWLAFLVVAAVTPLVVWDVPRTAHALTRFADPFGKHPWPTKTQLELLHPTPRPDGRIMLARGESLPVRFAVRGVLPEQAVVSLRLDGQPPDGDLLTLDNPEGLSELNIEHRLDANRLPRDFEFRVVANDADTGWQRVTVAPAPKLIPLEGRPSPAVSLTYPAYTDLPPAELSSGTGEVVAVAGTRVRFLARADRRIVSAYFRNEADLARELAATACAPLGGGNVLGAIAAQGLADEVVADVPVSVGGPDGTLLDADFVPHLPGLYILRFTDEDGLTGVRQFDFHIFPDPSPVVGMGRPVAGRDPLALLPSASVIVMTRAEDRPFAVKAIDLEYHVGGPEALLQSIPLADLGRAGRSLPALVGSVAGTPRLKPIGLDAGRVIPVAALRKPDGTPPADGDLIILRTAAIDWDDRTAMKAPGRSQEVEIRIMSRSSLEAQIQKDLAALRPEVARLLGEQRTARDSIGEVLKSTRAGTTRPEDPARIGEAEQSQRQIGNRMTDPEAGLVARAEQLKNVVRANDLPRSPTTEKVESVASALDRIASQPLEAAEPLLKSALHEAQIPGPDGNPKPDPKKLAELLGKAHRQQKAAEAGLASLLERLEEWGAPGEIRGDARAMRDEVNRIGQQAARAAAQVPDGKTANQLTPDEKATLANPADKFDRAADQAGDLLKKATRLAVEKEAQADALRANAADKLQKADALRKSADAEPPDSPAAEGMKSAAEAARAEANGLRKAADQAAAEAAALRNAVGEAGGDLLRQDLNRAADTLRGNQPGETQAARKSAADRLTKLSDSLVEEPAESPDELRKKQKAAAADITRLGNAQDELRRKTEAARGIADPMKRAEELQKLVREQEQLQKQAEQLAQRLTRERQDQPADAVRRAAEQMDAAREDLAREQQPGDKQDEALDRLDEALKELDREKKDDQEQLSREQREQLVEQLKAIREKQKAALDEAIRIHEAAAMAKGWDRPLQASLRDLEDREKVLAEELRAYAEKNLAELPVFGKLSGQSAEQMDRAARLVGDRLVDALDAATYDTEKEKATDTQTVRPMKTALHRLDQILDTLKEDPKARAKQPGEPGGGGPGGMDDGDAQPRDSGGGIPPLAQLKALRSMQAEVNEWTAEFAKTHPVRNKLTDEERDELKDLEQAQRDVAELFEKLAESFHPAEEMP